MDNGGLSNSDVALLADRNDGFGGNSLSSLIWLVAILGFFGGGIGGWGGNRGGGNFVTDQDLAISQNAQTQQLQNQELFNQIAENKFDLAQVVNAQTSQLEQQNNTNLINAIQGFNSLSGQVTNQTNVLSQQIQALSAQMNQCCCDIKTQMLQDRLSDTQAKLVTAQNAIDNANQSQYILSQLGRFVAWAGQGNQSLVSTAS